MNDVVRPGLIAIFGGGVAAFVLLVPFVAAEYRKRDRFTLRSAVTGLAVLIYGFALAAYTLLPLPQETAAFCAASAAGIQPVPFRSIGEIAGYGLGSPGAIAGNPALRQVALNVVLFLPFGFLARRITGRGVLPVTLAGLVVSLLIETTQLTGIWGLFPCAYRVADVDDLLVNTLGALLGALAAPLLGRRRPPVAPLHERPATVTAGRRLLGMVCDVLVGSAIGSLANATWVIPLALAGEPTNGAGPDALRVVTGTLVPAAVQLVVVLVSAQTIGEQVVRVQPTARPAPGRRVLRWLVGIGGWTLLPLLPLGGLLAAALAVASVIAVRRSRGHRGLAAAAAGQDVEPSPAIAEAARVV